MWIHELKGTGDLDPFEQVSHRFVSGIDDESIGYAAESLKLLRAEVMSRARPAQEARPRAVPGQEDHPGDRQPAQPEACGPLACVIDECQNLFAHPKYGKQAAEDADVHHQDRPGARRVPDPGHAAAGQGLACRPACPGTCPPGSA